MTKKKKKKKKTTDPDEQLDSTPVSCICLQDERSVTKWKKLLHDTFHPLGLSQTKFMNLVR